MQNEMEKYREVKIMKKSKYLKVTMAVTIIYSCLCFVSAGCILYGSDKVVQFGKYLVRLWIFNPIAVILSVIGIIRKRKNQGRFIFSAVLSIVSWMVAGMLIAVRF